MQTSAAAALAAGLEVHPGCVTQVLTALTELYHPGERTACVCGG